MDLDSKNLRDLIHGMRGAYANGENAMAYAREALKAQSVAGRNQRLATLIAYDLQAGTYIEAACANPEGKQLWCRQIANLIAPLLPKGGSLLELGVGEATTLAGVLAELKEGGQAFGFDISWSRIRVANDWLRKQAQTAELFVGDLLNIPLVDNSIDVVYSSHSLEPNGGREKEAIAEGLRVARRYLVLVEPLYELASTEAQARMRHHGYVRGLRETAEQLGAEVLDYRLLGLTSNPLNPTGVLTLRKVSATNAEPVSTEADKVWQCPLSGSRLERTPEGLFAPAIGIFYPTLSGVPLLRVEHAVIASKFSVSQ